MLDMNIIEFFIGMYVCDYCDTVCFCMDMDF